MERVKRRTHPSVLLKVAGTSSTWNRSMAGDPSSWNDYETAWK